MGNVTVEAALFLPAALAGWTASIGGAGGCAAPNPPFIEPGRTCRIELRAAANAGTGVLVLYEESRFETIVGVVLLWR